MDGEATHRRDLMVGRMTYKCSLHLVQQMQPNSATDRYKPRSLKPPNKCPSGVTELFRPPTDVNYTSVPRLRSLYFSLYGCFKGRQTIQVYSQVKYQSSDTCRTALFPIYHPLLSPVFLHMVFKFRGPSCSSVKSHVGAQSVDNM